jgi:hypothetical protein
MAGGKDTDQIVVGGNGSVFVAPVGSTEPTSISIALDAAFIDIGYVTEDGATFLDGKTIEDINVWQLFYAARKLITGKEASLAFVLAQWSETVIPLAFGGGITIVDIVGEFSYTPPAPGVLDERAMILEWVDGTKNYRLIIPRGLVTENVETNIVKTGSAELPITFSIVGSAAGIPWYLQTDDPALDPAN